MNTNGKRPLAHTLQKQRYLQSLQGLCEQAKNSMHDPTEVQPQTFPYFLASKFSLRCQLLRLRNNMGERIHDGCSTSYKKCHFGIRKCPFLFHLRGSNCTWLTQVFLLTGWWKRRLPVTTVKQAFKYCFFRSNIKLSPMRMCSAHKLKWNGPHLSFADFRISWRYYLSSSRASVDRQQGKYSHQLAEQHDTLCYLLKRDSVIKCLGL